MTTRANLQIREIGAENAVKVIEAIQDLGLCSRGSGADNIRNVTGTPTAGIDPQELLDTRPFAREWHFHILNDRSLTGLPRKFNVAFDGAGRVAVLEETNDIGFQAVEVRDGAAVPAGIYFRLVLGGITGHKDLARDTGIVLPPAEATRVADAIVRVFIDSGDRTNRNKARLKYVLDAWGFEKFLAAVEDKLGAKLARVDATHVKPRPEADRLAHLGVHPQKQAGLNWIGLVLPVGKLTVEQMRAIASARARSRRRRYPPDRLAEPARLRRRRRQRAARRWSASRRWGSPPRRPRSAPGSSPAPATRAASSPPPTPRARPKRSRSTSKAGLELDQPINIHLTGCHHSCAQHYVGDIGLIAAQVPVNEDGDTVEGFHIVVGGGTGANARIGRELFRDVKKEDCPEKVEQLLRAYLAHRESADDTFFAFANRHDTEALSRFVEEQTA